MTPNRFKSSYYDLGRFKKLFYICAAAFNAIVFSVMISPFVFPVTAETFNFVRIIVFFFLVGVHNLTTRAGSRYLRGGYDPWYSQLVLHSRGEMAPT